MRSLLDTNLKEAIRSQEKQRLATLRLINAAIKDRDIAVRSEENTEGVSDSEIILIPVSYTHLTLPTTPYV